MVGAEILSIKSTSYLACVKCYCVATDVIVVVFRMVVLLNQEYIDNSRGSGTDDIHGCYSYIWTAGRGLG